MTRTPTPEQVAQAMESAVAAELAHGPYCFTVGQRGACVCDFPRRFDALAAAIASALAQAHAEGRQAALEEAVKEVEAIQDQRREEIKVRCCLSPDDPDCACDYFAGEFNGLNDPLSRLRQLATEARS